MQPYLFLNPYKLLLPYGPPFAVGGNAAPALRDFAGATNNANLTLRPVGSPVPNGQSPSLYRLYTWGNRGERFPRRWVG
jgi:hypothetical protein